MRRAAHADELWLRTPSSPSGPAWWSRIRADARRLVPFAGLAFFALALWGLQQSLHGLRYEHIVSALAALPSWRLAAALAITVAGYVVLAGYDMLALRFIRHPANAGTVATAAMVSGALGNNVGNTLLAGAAVRYWIYTAAGLTATQITRVVLFCSGGFWLGYLFLGAFAFSLKPLALPAPLHLGLVTTRPLGLVLAAVLAGWLTLCVRGRPMALARLRIELPSVPLTLGQIAIASCDLSLMGTALFVLLPPTPGLTIVTFAPVFLVALIAGAASQVPGGLGVFEAVVMLLLADRLAPRDLAASLLAFRAIYLLLPLLAAAVFVGLRIGPKPRSAWRAWVERGTRSLQAIAPSVVAALAFVAGAVLLVSGALPAAVGRLVLVERLFALPVIEASHFFASLIGSALLVVARGLQRRLDAAWLLATGLLAAGAVLSLLKGWDFEEASVLAIVLLVLLPLRRQFYRTSSLLNAPFTPAWVASCAIVLAGSTWLVLVTQSEAGLASQAWWDFSWHAEASRSERASAGAIGLFVLLALHHLLRPARDRSRLPAQVDIERARPIVERCTRTYANLVFRGDKSLLFSTAGDAFLMYGRRGRSWIAMGDPIGPEDGVREVAWRFREQCDRADGWCVFFEVGADRRELYAELGLVLTPVGEEARVDLSAFDIETPAHKDLRHARSRLQRAGCRFEIAPRAAVPALLPALAGVSRAWLAHKATHEKGFSNASFDEGYLSRFPVAIVRRGQDIVAFANVWQGAGREELSVDLMRHRPDAPNGTMDFLFGELLLWGRTEGFRWFNLGMAPLAGLESSPGAALYDRLGGFIYRHAEHFYNFDGLRRYKAKFRPVWTPLYLASPGGLALSPVLLDVTALIAGSVGGIVSRRDSSPAHRPRARRLPRDALR